jgi:hypothetical protein
LIKINHTGKRNTQACIHSSTKVLQNKNERKNVATAFTSRRMIIISSSSYILLRWWSSQKRERERETKREKLLQPKPLWISWVVGRINKKPSRRTFLLG